MKINELIVESQTDEGLGSMIGKGVGALARGAGAVAGGIAGIGAAAKKGYAAGKATVAGDPDPAAAGGAPAPTTPPAGGTAPTAPPAQGTAPAGGTSAPAQGGFAPAQGGTQPASSGGSAPAQAGGSAPAAAPNSGELGGIMQAIDKLDKPTKQQLAGELEKNISSTAEPAPEKSAGGTAPTTPPAGGTAPTTPPAGGTAPTTPPAGGKLTQAQQDAMKAKLQGKRAAGQTTASQTGSGFKDYVGGSQTKLTGADAQGNPVFKKLQRESVAFSNFLGVHI
jgi:hypothetical protein